MGFVCFMGLCFVAMLWAGGIFGDFACWLGLHDWDEPRGHCLFVRCRRLGCPAVSR